MHNDFYKQLYVLWKINFYVQVYYILTGSYQIIKKYFCIQPHREKIVSLTELQFIFPEEKNL